MAKKIVRGITDIKTISKQDFNTNNVNDLLSDGEHNYIHRKKGSTDEYYCLTDNVKKVISNNEGMIGVSRDGDTVSITPWHDKYKEQVLESENSTITLNNAQNGSTNKTKIDVNPAKVLKHENLVAGTGIKKQHVNDEWVTTVSISDDFISKVNGKQDTVTVGKGLSFNSNKIEFNPSFQDLVTTENGIFTGAITGDGEHNLVISLNNQGVYIQIALRNSTVDHSLIISKYRFIIDNVPTSWKNMLIDEQKINELIDTKINAALQANEATTDTPTTLEE